jgi:hypothetical protein
MCYGSPAKSLELARARTTPEQWAKWAFFKGRTRSMVLDNTQRIRVARFERIGLAMMSDEQAQMSVERWEQVNLERVA